MIETQFGYHIIQKTDHDAGGAADFDEVREQIRDLLRHARRGEAVTAYVEELKAKIDGHEKEIEEETIKISYIKESKLHAFNTALGVFIIFMAVISLEMFGVSPYQPMIFFSMIGVAVSLFIIFNFRYANFKLENPILSFYYSKEEIQNFNTKFSFLISLGIILILFGIGTANVGGEIVLLSSVAVAAFIFVYMGLLKSRFDINNYNNKEKKKDTLVDKVTSIIMLSATFIFLLLGFLLHLWHIAWVVFPLGGILCGIVAIILEKK